MFFCHKKPLSESVLLAGLIAIGTSISACANTSGVVSDELFIELDTPIEHHWDKSAHPFLGAAVIDVNSDGTFEIFVGGGEGEPDALLDYQSGALVNVIEGTGLSSLKATHGVKAIDMDADGDTDMLIARVDGVALYENQGGRFTRRNIPIEAPEQAEPFDIAVADIDRDGDADIYVSYFVAFPAFKSATFNDPDHAKLNRMLVNNGDNTFTDVTEETGTASHANTFCSVFSDLDGDGLQDLIVAQNTWEVEIYKNNGNLDFTPVPTSSGYGFWMGVGVADYDNDGDQDLYFPNVGSSISPLLTMGDIREDQRHTHDWLLLRNEGGMNFSTVTGESGLLDDGFAWGGVFEDINLDGWMDLYVAQNYIKWPPHWLLKLPSRAFSNELHATGDRVFVDQGARWGVSNPYYAQSSLIVDIDQDGYQDLLWINMDGPLRAFLRKPTGRFLNVQLDDNVENLGATVVVSWEGGQSYVREIVAGEGFLTDQSPVKSFALPDKENVSVTVTWPDGISVNLPLDQEQTLRISRPSEKRF